MQSPEQQSTKAEDREPVFPEDLTEKDRKLVIKQCKLQNATSPEEIEGFAQAYYEAKEQTDTIETFNALTANELEEWILHLANIIDPQNASGYRAVPVRFGNFNQAVPPDNIPRAMHVYTEFFAKGTLTAEEVYREFEEIHPFKDGNGRVGDLLWKIRVTQETGDWPQELPPDLFNDEEHDSKRSHT